MSSRASVAQALGRIDQVLATLPGLGDPLRKVVAGPLLSPIFSGPQPVNLALAEQVRTLAGSIGAGVPADDSPNGSE